MAKKYKKWPENKINRSINGQKISKTDKKVKNG